RPHLAGSLKATQLAVEMPSAGGNSGQPQWVHLDSADVEGSYSPTQIAIEHAQLLHGNSRIALSGTLDASAGLGLPTTAPRHFRGSLQPTYDGNSVLHARVDAKNLDVADLQPFLVA